MSEPTTTLENDTTQQRPDFHSPQLLDLDTEDISSTEPNTNGAVEDDNTSMALGPPKQENDSDDTSTQPSTHTSPNTVEKQDEHLAELANHQDNLALLDDEQTNNDDDGFDWGDSVLDSNNKEDTNEQDMDTGDTNDFECNRMQDTSEQDIDNEFGSSNGTDEKEEEEDDDEFGDFGDFGNKGDGSGDDDDDFDDFGDFDELPNEPFPDTTDQQEGISLETTTAPSSESTFLHQYIELLEAGESDMTSFMETTLSQIWTPLGEETDSTLVESPISLHASSPTDEYSNNELLCTECSLDLWQKLSRDSVFYNPITGAIGQFQWTRSEINRAYLNALGVRINYEDRLQDVRPTSMTSSPSRPHSHALHSSSPTTASSSSYMLKSGTSNHVRSNSLTNDMSLTGGAMAAALHGSIINGPSKLAIEEEPELDIDIAKAYCELTEETIRVFPDVKLNAMVIELSRLQRQAKEYLGYLLDQREQLMMDAETYNDLISCIVGHAQRLKEQNAAKDASPAMVSKKKKTGGGFSGMIKRKNTTGGGTSMGGGVVGVKQSNVTKSPAEGRRSM
ncbi:hypothetical protein BC941DRAFT_439385 [Chlamydoabsidia padenii]|nr:hypothetical protein BC941DRAFT_439385 [Chlamydoabsidia padenii]